MEAQKDNDQSTIDSVEYNPIESLTLPKMGKVEPRGLVLVVGPNSSGKTQFFRDVDYAVNGEARDLVVCEAIARSLPPDLDAFVNDLIEKGYFRWVKDAANEGLQHIKPQFGVGQGQGGVMRPDQPRKVYEESKEKLTSGQSMSEVIFFRAFRHCLSTALFLERRLSLTEPTRRYDPDDGLARSDLQALFLDQTAQQALSEEVQRTLSLGVWLDSTGKELCIRVDQSGTVPAADKRLQPSAMEKYRLIGTEGDGVRSYVGMCVALLLGRCPILLIDEPELGLHPPQAHAIGRFIGRFGTSIHRTTFVATHSSHVLRGVIETAPQAQLLRLSRWSGHFVAHLVDKETVKSSLGAPTVRAETILDGVFSDGVVVVESEGDRAVYEAAWDGIDSSFHREVRFVPVGGTGGIAQAVRFYRAMRIPTAVIADLDLVVDDKTLNDTLLALSEENTVAPIVENARIALGEIRRIPPAIGEQQAKALLAEAIAMSLDWRKNDDERLYRSVRNLSNDLDRMRRLKKGGVKSYADHPELTDRLESIINECRKVGLFLVPVGELEYWAGELMAGGPSKTRKAEWASEAARRIRHSPQQARDIVEFVRLVGDFQLVEAQKVAIG